MNLEYFIARRTYTQDDGEKKISPPAIRIAIFSIALGLAIMILTLAIIVGFKKEVRNKISGFGSHIQITNFDSNSSYETAPIVVNDSLVNEIRKLPNINHIDRFATKPGIIKTDDNYLGVVLKGVDSDYNWNFFKQNLKCGTILAIDTSKNSTDVLISQSIADKLNFRMGDSFITYFVQDQIRARKFHIAGIYQTNFSEYDKMFIFTDIKQIQNLNQWEPDQISGVEILVNDFDLLDKTTEDLYYKVQTFTDRTGNSLYSRSIKQLNPAVFSWLDVLNMNVIIILVLMLFVAAFSMISGLLIIILEKNRMIGILKTLGQNNSSIRKIFLYISSFLIGKGLFWGNLIAISVWFVQKQFGIFALNPDVYYIDKVPIDLNIWHVILLNAGTMAIILLILIIPSYLIAKISPIKSIRFE